MKKWLKRFIPALLISIAVTLGMAAAYKYQVLMEAQRRIYNAKLRVRGQIPQTGNVVIATIDNYSVRSSNLGRWPWPRTYMGYLLDALNDYGAEIIGFDVFFPEPDESVPLYGMRNFLRTNFEMMGLDQPDLSEEEDEEEFLENLNEFYDIYLGAKFERNPEIGKIGDEVERALNPDLQLARSLERNKNVILGYYFEEHLAPKEYIEELDHYYEKMEANFIKKNMEIPDYVKDDMELMVGFLEKLGNKQKAHTPYKSLRKDVDDFWARFEQDAKEGLEESASLPDELGDMVNEFYSMCTGFVFRGLYEDMAYLVREPAEEIQTEMSFNYAGMEKSAIEYESSSSAVIPFVHARTLTPNIQRFTERCEHFGHVSVKPDPDGVIRHHFPAEYYGGLLFPSLAMKAAELYLDEPLKARMPLPGNRPRLKLGDINVPLDGHGRMLINYFGPKPYPRYSIFDIISGMVFNMPAQQTIPEYFREVKNTTPEAYFEEMYGEPPREGDIGFMLMDVYEDNAPLSRKIVKWEAEQLFEQKYGITPQEAFGGKVVLVGATATGIYDLRVTPFSEDTPGVEIHAQVIDGILKKDFFRLPEWEETYVYAMLIGLAVVMAFLMPLMGAVRGALLTLVLLGAIIAVDYFYFFLDKGNWLPVVYQSIQVGSLFLLITVYRYATEEREKRFIKDTFGRYLAPSVVEHLTRNPEMLQLGGETAELTAFFSDIQGFSTISEKLNTAEELVELLNEYLSAMAGVIEEYEGTIDKYEGDAIIAFWGAPVHFSDHALKACYACLDQQRKLAELREKWAEEGKWPEIVHDARVRMGLNTGPMVVGNMGSEGRMNYTVMGDTVNLAARLEGANKTYGTYIMIAEDTYEQVKGYVEVRELDLLRVVGKEEPVRVYELLGRKGEMDDTKSKLLEVYNRGLGFYRQKNWEKAMETFREALEIDPDDGPSRAYVERCRQYMENPPPPDWDGVYTLTEK